MDAAAVEDREARLAGVRAGRCCGRRSSAGSPRPRSGCARKVAMTYSPSGKFSSGPRSASFSSRFVNEGRTMKPRTGSVTTAPIAAPRPIVDASRKRERVYAGSGSCGVAVVVGDASARRRRRASPARSSGTSVAHVARHVACPEDSERDGEDRADAATIQLTTSPSSRQATPIAKPIGQRLGPGACGVSWLVSLKSRPAVDSIALRSRLSTTCRLSRRGDSALCGGRVS